MPIFEYRCGKCGHEFEELESVADRDRPRNCPECGSKRVARVISVFAAKVGGCSSSSPSGGSGGFS